MTAKTTRQIVGVIALIISGNIYAQTQVPNTFQAGQPARAADVNANFSAVESAVNDNDNRITANANDIASNSSAISSNTAPFYVVLDSTGQQVGDRVVDVSAMYATVPFSLLLSTGETIEFFAIMNGRGFLGSDSQTATNLIYLQPDCAGQAYMQISPDTRLLAPSALAAILIDSTAPLGTPANLWRATSNIPESLTTSSIQYAGSVDNPQSCVNGVNPLDNLYPAVFEVDLHQLLIPPFTLQRVN